MAKRYLQEHKSDVHMTDEEFEAIKDARRNQVHASKDVSSVSSHWECVNMGS